MAKKERELSAAEKTLSDARVKLDAAKEKDGKASTDATKKAVADAETVVKTNVAIVNRERFVRVGGGRVKKARAAIRNIGNVAQPRSYTYDESDVVKAETALNDEVKKTIAKLRLALTKGPAAAKDGDDFAF